MDSSAAAAYSPVSPTDDRLAGSTTADAFYDKETESLTLGLQDPSSPGSINNMDEKADLLNSEGDADPGSTLDEDHRYSTVLLGNKAKQSRWRSFCPTYHSADPDRTVTPFAVVLLVVLFAIYILNQADRLVLPIAIPTGLRCETSKDNCRNLTSTEENTMTYIFTDPPNDSNSSNRTDCISFNDYEQGLLTGKFALLVGGAD
jgi:hypothetical protein